VSVREIQCDGVGVRAPPRSCKTLALCVYVFGVQCDCAGGGVGGWGGGSVCL